MNNQIDLFKELSKPFAADDIEWRIQRSGIKNGNVWAMAIPYITNRAIQHRLDEVFGPLGWKNEQKQIEGGWLCGISVYCSNLKEWVTKWDGAENTKKRNNDDMDIIKGGLSSSMKRAAVHWGIGRYLYNLDATFADCFQNNQGKNRATALDKQTNQKIYYSWNAPQLPEWALPEKKQVNQGAVYTSNKNQWRNDQEKQQKEAQRQKHRDNIKKMLDDKGYPHEQFCQDWKLDSMDNIQLYNVQKMIDWINQIPEQPQEQQAPDRNAKVINPKEVSDIRSALKFVKMDEADFCKKARIDVIGQLTEDRYEQAMDWLFSLATDKNEPTVEVIEAEVVDEPVTNEQIRDLRRGIDMANVAEYSFLTTMNVRTFQDLKASQIPAAHDWIEKKYKAYQASLPKAVIRNQNTGQINNQPCRRERDREIFRDMAAEDARRVA